MMYGFSTPVTVVVGAFQARTTPSGLGVAASAEGGTGTSSGTIVTRFETCPCVVEAHRSAVAGVEWRIVLVQQPRAHGRGRQVGAFYAVQSLPELRELHRPQARHFREERYRRRDGRINITGQEITRIAGRLGHRQLLDVAVDDDASNRGQLLSRRGERWIAPGENHFGTALCYNEIAGRLRDDRNRWVRIAALATRQKQEDCGRAQLFQQRGF